MNQYRPMLAKPADAPFTQDDWIFEVKWDGIRAISYIGDEIIIKSRNQKEISWNFPELSELKDLAHNVVLDGEIVVMKDGKADFQSLVQRIQNTNQADIRYMAAKFPSTYVIFDILEKNGEPLLDIPLIERKNILKDSVKEGKFAVISIFIEKTGEAYYEAAMKKGIEGIMAKKKTSPYEPGKRSDNWLKIKRLKACDCVIFGYTKGEGRRGETFASLILGLFDGKEPVFVGKVGTGFAEEDMGNMKQLLDKYRVDEKTIEGVDLEREITWIRPALVCEVSYQSVTDDRKLRIPVFKGFREDKDPQECTIEQIRPFPSDYNSKRNFTMTNEPVMAKETGTGLSFVVHEHHARRLHYDLRLEKDGVLKSWAVPKGIPEKSGDKRLAVQVEDHPLEYRKFEGTIPKGQYGAGTVKIWDKGSYLSKVWDDEKIEFAAKGDKMEGRYILVKFKKAGRNDWLLLKGSD